MSTNVDRVATAPEPRLNQPSSRSAQSRAAGQAAVVRIGFPVVAAAFVAQAAAHLAHTRYGLGPRRLFNADVERGFTAWSGSALFLAAGLVFLRPGARRMVGATLAAAAGLTLLFFAVDDVALVHERLSDRLVVALGLDADYGRIAWPLLYLPLLATVFVALWRVQRHREARPLVRAGLALLAVAVALEMGSAPFFAEDLRFPSGVAALEVALEEAAELAGWIAITAGLLAVTRPGDRPASARDARSAGEEAP